MLKSLIVLFVGLSLSETIWATESYTCSYQQFDSQTGAEVKRETKTIALTEFSSSCKKGPCKSENHLFGGNEGDPFSFNLVLHNAKSPVMAAMIMSFRLDSKIPYEGSSLAGTDYGNRLYTQVNAGNSDFYIECQYTTK